MIDSFGRGIAIHGLEGLYMIRFAAEVGMNVQISFERVGRAA